jgi:DNA-binding transcriptional LysR family regulator
MNLDWRISMALKHLAVFECSVVQGSFSKAAEKLGTTQPSVSRHIASLENLLGVALFTRLYHRVELTTAGQEFYDAVQLGLGHIRQAANRITTQRNPDTLSIGCTYGFAHLWLMPRFSALQKIINDQELRMITSDAKALFNLDDVDFALRFGRGDWDDGDAQVIFKEQLFPVCSPQFAQQHFAGSCGVDPAFLATVPLIHEYEEINNWLSWGQWLAHHRVDYAAPDNAVYYDNYAMTLQAAMEGQGVALAWMQFTEPYLKIGQLVELESLRVDTDCGYYLVSRPHHPLAEKIGRWFKEMAIMSEP